MATTVREAEELIKLARERNVRLVPSPGEMLRPHNQYIKEIIWRGEIGTLCWAACGAAFGTYHQDEAERQGSDILSNVDPSWYFRKPGGGPLYDMTVYALTALTGILGSVLRVTALSGTRIKEREFRGALVPCDADDNTVMLLDFGQPFRFCLWNCQRLADSRIQRKLFWYARSDHWTNTERKSSGLSGGRACPSGTSRLRSRMATSERRQPVASSTHQRIAS